MNSVLKDVEIYVNSAVQFVKEPANNEAIGIFETWQDVVARQLVLLPVCSSHPEDSPFAGGNDMSPLFNNHMIEHRLRNNTSQNAIGEQHKISESPLAIIPFSTTINHFNARLLCRRDFIHIGHLAPLSGNIKKNDFQDFYATLEIGNATLFPNNKDRSVMLSTISTMLIKDYLATDNSNIVSRLPKELIKDNIEYAKRIIDTRNKASFLGRVVIGFKRAS